jgi:hypothetical protein
MPVTTGIMQNALAIHQLRKEATTPHPEDSDGSGKTGINESDAKWAFEQFQRLLPLYVQRVWNWVSKANLSSGTPAAHEAG